MVFIYNHVFFISSFKNKSFLYINDLSLLVNFYQIK